MRDELELIRAAAGGDRQAFGELVRIKRERVVRAAYQITGDMDDAMDVAQGVFLKLWQGLDRYDRRHRFDTWLYRITVNAAIDMLRSRGPKGFIQPLQQDAPHPSSGAAGEAEAAVDFGRLQQAFLRLAARLAPKQRAVFVLRDIEGLSTSEVARSMGVAESTVRNHLFQARRILKAGLQRDYPDLVPRISSGKGPGGRPED